MTRICFTLKNLVHELQGGIVVKSYAWQKYDGTIELSNWGDDINWLFLKEIIAKPLVSYDHSFLAKKGKKDNYIIIGSTIDLLADDNSIIWGAGIINSKVSKLPHFKEIKAVRGPKTRGKLIELGYDCPEVYGDPALLIPMHYQPNVRKTHHIGVIPHFHDLPMVKELFSDREDIKIINIREYGDWRSFINELVSCENIASSSLHGLIMAYAYNIPNQWVEFRGCEERDRFKYDDFFYSIGKFAEKPLPLNSTEDLLVVQSYLEKWERGNLDLLPLIESAPFELNL